MILDGYELAILVLLGLAVGSFLNVCIHRLPLGQSLKAVDRFDEESLLVKWIGIPIMSLEVGRALDEAHCG